jgi:hypothetical protein
MPSRTSPCTVDVQAVSGGSVHTLATIPDDPNCLAMTFGDSLLVTTGTADASGPLAIIDVGTGAQHSIAVQGLLGTGIPDWASPDASELAVPVGRGADRDRERDPPAGTQSRRCVPPAGLGRAERWSVAE